MVRHFYRLRMRTFAAALRQHSRREMLQKVRFQYSLMQLGNELKSSKPSIAAGLSLELERDAIKVVPHSLAPQDPAESDGIAVYREADQRPDLHQLSSPALERPFAWSATPTGA
ncbi:hypothetical protein ACNJYD_09975 [Bradyrhizobium sp. DASA03005]|uniref:hypothetical protein n=1 Tax=Bradyrhizobium sp. SPXBL-02 TaxID=3395912 RepID=UPI003F6FF6EF